MKNTKTIRIIFWISTVIIFLFEGVLTALTSHTEMAKAGVQHLGYPDYFRVMIMVYKVLGCVVLIIPAIKGRIKEWAYAGLAFCMISAFVSHWAVDGFHPETLFPIVVLGILMTSYFSYHRLHQVPRV